jgi:hypothetical protein
LQYKRRGRCKWRRGRGEDNIGDNVTGDDDTGCDGISRGRSGFDGRRADDTGIAGDGIDSRGDGISWCWSGEPAG